MVLQDRAQEILQFIRFQNFIFSITFHFFKPEVIIVTLIWTLDNVQAVSMQL